MAGGRERGVRVGLQPVEDRQREGGRLAGSRLGGGQDVATLQHEGDGPFLDGRGLRVALVDDRPQQLRGQAKVFKSQGVSCSPVRARVGGGPCRLVVVRRGALAGQRGRRRPPDGAEHTRKSRTWAHRERARSTSARRAGVVHAVHEYAHDERASASGRAAAGMPWRRSAALGLDAARVFKTIVVAVDGRLALAVVPADGEVDLKAVADALGGRRAVVAPAAEAEKATGYVLGGISPLGTRRPLPVVVDTSARLVPHDPRLRRATRPGDRARRRGPRRAHRGPAGADRPRGFVTGPRLAGDLRPLGPHRGDGERHDEPHRHDHDRQLRVELLPEARRRRRRRRPRRTGRPRCPRRRRSRPRTGTT